MPHIKLTQGGPTGLGLYLSESEISPDLQWLIFSSTFRSGRHYFTNINIRESFRGFRSHYEAPGWWRSTSLNKRRPSGKRFCDFLLFWPRLDTKERPCSHHRNSDHSPVTRIEYHRNSPRSTSAANVTYHVHIKCLFADFYIRMWSWWRQRCYSSSYTCHPDFYPCSWQTKQVILS